MTRRPNLRRCGKLWSGVLFLSACVFCLLCAHSRVADAATDPMAALSAARYDPDQQAVYVVKHIKDYAVIKERFLKSELRGSLERLEPAFRELFGILDRFPVRSLAALMIVERRTSEPFMQVALAFDERSGATLQGLKKIAAGSASSDDVMRLLGIVPKSREAALMTREMKLRADKPFYWMGPLPFTAYDNLLIFSNSANGLVKSLRALRGEEPRVTLTREFRGDNYVYFGLSSALTQELAEEVFPAYVSRDGDTDPAARLLTQSRFSGGSFFEMELLPEENGWRVDLGTNFLELLVSDKDKALFEERRRPEFVPIGGGKILLAGSAGISLPVGARKGGDYPGYILLSCLNGVSGAKGIFGVDLLEPLKNFMLSLNAVDFAVAQQGKEIGFSLRMFSSGRKETARFRAAFDDEFSRAARGKLPGVRFKRSSAEGWNRVYTVESLSEDGEGQPLTLKPGLYAFAPAQALVGALGMDDLADRAAIPAGSLLEELAHANENKEFLYADAGQLRRVVDRLDLADRRWRKLRSFASALTDVSEVGLETLSLRHFTIRIRTGGSSLDDLLRELAK